MVIEALPFSGWCKVQGRYLLAEGDTVGDVDKYPDGVAAVGTVTLSPDWDIMNFSGASPMGTGVVSKKIVLTLDSDGYLTYNSDRYVYIVPTDDPGGNPLDTTWTASFDLADEDGNKLNLKSFSFSAPEGTTIDLPSVAPVSQSGGILTMQGPPGNGIVSIIRTSGTGAPGTNDIYTITFDDLSTTTFTVHNGSNGIDGIDGIDGVDATVNDANVNSVISAAGNSRSTIEGIALVNALIYGGN